MQRSRNCRCRQQARFVISIPDIFKTKSLWSIAAPWSLSRCLAASLALSFLLEHSRRRNLIGRIRWPRDVVRNLGAGEMPSKWSRGHGSSAAEILIGRLDSACSGDLRRNRTFAVLRSVGTKPTPWSFEDSKIACTFLAKIQYFVCVHFYGSYRYLASNITRWLLFPHSFFFNEISSRTTFQMKICIWNSYCHHYTTPWIPTQERGHPRL